MESVIYNAIPDWVNEEEVFEDNKALYWSPNAERLIYGVFNDTAVEVVRLPRYGNWREDSINRQGYPFLQYFLFDDFKYPKAGTANPSVTVWCAEVGPPGPTASDRSLRQYILPPPRSLATTENHFTFVTWADNETVAVNWMNRVQNLTAINLCKVYRGTKTFFATVFSRKLYKCQQNFCYFADKCPKKYLHNRFGTPNIGLQIYFVLVDFVIDHTVKFSQ